MLLLVQAPDFSKAVKAKQLLARWRQTLEHQSRVFPMSSLARVRLVAYYAVGLDETFHLPPHVQQALKETTT